MEEISASPAADRTGWMKPLILGAIALVLILGAFYAYQAWTNQQTGAATPGTEGISAAELEASYGLQVRLIGMTAAGGMIDFRLKMIDPDKAQAFLQDPANLPITMVAEDGSQLLAADGMDDDITWEADGILFILLPNTAGVVQPGTEVIVQFGSVNLEPILAQ